MSTLPGRELNNYFIKAGIQGERRRPSRMRSSPGSTIGMRRGQTSLRYQYPVYMSAKKVISRGGIQQVIDVGCGVATKLEMLHGVFPGVEFTGIDQPSTIEFCRRRYPFGRWVADDLECPDGGPAGTDR